jgi:hypothetical protein
MLTIELAGGLGNQLFQIFVTISLAMRTNQTFYFTYAETLGSEFLKETVRITYWNTLLKNLKQYTSNEPIKSNGYYINEVNHNYHPMPFLNLDNDDLFILRGYYQSYKYFIDQFQEIYKMIDFDKGKEEILKSNPKLSSEILDKDSISMHFRLGDYKSRIDWHPIMKVEYFKKSVDAILSRIIKNDQKNQEIKIFYFCEEEDLNYVYYLIDEIRRHVSHSKWKDLKCTFTHIPEKIPDYQQLMLMSSCNHNIIANSSFSLWSAYLNSHKDKIVCYPSNWFGVRNKSDTSDMFPEDWIKINLET